MLTDVDRAYIAGIFDGEGSVIIVPPGKGQHVEIANTNLNLCLWLKELLGGQIYTYKRSDGRGKQNYRWYLAHKEKVLEFINLINPYTRIKRDQLDILKEYITYVDIPGGRSMGLDEDTKLYRAILYGRLHELNKKGGD